ncbi:hypothetical protein [Spiroplasma tabanidicola]|uniref:Uncharacterized protein n=1 Tax=Spiroplasma tabanidicola TaxID=324079 RepID=A0A6I6C3Y5_9MOLU|nr:hypothetical protein [Spiroplasma tabanidicola]QGS51527.1 hypothetical protein STABA_v1c01600 [Spiroplasma tabanidicola]
MKNISKSTNNDDVLKYDKMISRFSVAIIVIGAFVLLQEIWTLYFIVKFSFKYGIWPVIYAMFELNQIKYLIIVHVLFFASGFFAIIFASIIHRRLAARKEGKIVYTKGIFVMTIISIFLCFGILYFAYWIVLLVRQNRYKGIESNDQKESDYLESKIFGSRETENI